MKLQHLCFSVEQVNQHKHTTSCRYWVFWCFFLPRLLLQTAQQRNTGARSTRVRRRATSNMYLWYQVCVWEAGLKWAPPPHCRMCSTHRIRRRVGGTGWDRWILLRDRAASLNLKLENVDGRWVTYPTQADETELNTLGGLPRTWCRVWWFECWSWPVPWWCVWVWWRRRVPSLQLAPRCRTGPQTEGWPAQEQRGTLPASGCSVPHGWWTDVPLGDLRWKVWEKTPLRYILLYVALLENAVFFYKATFTTQ